jgi:hypothetical protein
VHKGPIVHAFYAFNFVVLFLRFVFSCLHLRGSPCRLVAFKAIRRSLEENPFLLSKLITNFKYCTKLPNNFIS